MRRCGPNKVNGHSTKTFCQNIKAAATVRKVDQWIWPSRKNQSTAAHMQVLQQQWLATAIGCRSGSRSGCTICIGLPKKD